MSGKSTKRGIWVICAGLIIALSIPGGRTFSNPTHGSPPQVDLTYPAVQGQVLRLTDPPGSEMTEQGRDVRGIYLPVSKIQETQPRELAKWVSRDIGATAVIIDIKDDRGRVTFSGNIPGGGQISSAMSRRVPNLVAQLKKEGIYVIGRLVCFKDNLFPRKNPTEAVTDRRTGKIWKDRANMTWIDPYSNEAHRYIARVAEAAEDTGFDEIQLDYIRFPVEPEARHGTFPNNEGGTDRYEAIRRLLERVDNQIKLPLSIDVFGLTAYRQRDSERLGQWLEQLAPHIDAISPMLYLANWDQEIWENPRPARTKALVHDAIVNIRSRLGDHIAVRPLLQGFSYRAENWGTPFLQNQIKAAETAGSSGYLFWNQSGNYTRLSVIWRSSVKPHILSPQQ